MPVVLACPQPNCNGWLEYEEVSSAGPVYRCNRCSHGTLARNLTAAPVVTAQASEKPKGRSGRAKPEYTLGVKVKEALEALGCVVMRTGQRNAKFGGQDAGCPDMFVSTYSGQPTWTAVELKTPTGTFSPAQKVLQEQGRVLCWRSVEDALDWYAREAM